MNKEYLHVSKITIERMRNLAGNPGMLESRAATEQLKQRTEDYVAMPESYLG